MNKRRILPFLLLSLAACADPPEVLAPSQPADTTVKVDLLHRPLPEMPLPNDLATVWDERSVTKRRINASVLAPTFFERLTRERVDQMDGWGVFAPITVPFSGPLDPESVRLAHANGWDHPEDDAVYLVDVTKGSKEYGQIQALDVGNGQYPVTLEDIGGYWEHDPRGWTLSVMFDEANEDANGNGKLDEGEDTDLDGVLDQPNYLPGKSPTKEDLVGRSNALMTFYERETHTLMVRPLKPLRPRTTYAMVVTRRVKDAKGQPVGSPWAGIHHASQYPALLPLVDILQDKPKDFGGLKVEDIAFAWSFTTGSVYDDITAVRDGLYGLGPQSHLGAAFPPELSKIHQLWAKDAERKDHEKNLYVVSAETMELIITLISQADIGFSLTPNDDYGQRALESLRYVDYHVFGSYRSPRLFPRQDAAGNYLSYNEMSWPADLFSDVTRVTAWSETSTFWMAVPRKEVSPRKDGKPAGLVIIGHGYTGNKLTTLQFAGYFARHGIATLCVENVSHGADFLGPKDLELVKGVFEGLGLPGIADGLLSNRSWDQDLDGKEDSGGDFWTSYTFHTRDVVRQSAVDLMQLVRVFRAFDGKRTWNFDTSGDGKIDEKDVAGDFDGDGVVDVGGKDAILGMTGSSLGGMMSAVVGGLEPQISAVVPVCAGGGLGDVGLRSLQGGVREAVMLRLMGPLYVGFPEDGQVTVKTVVPRLNNTARVPVATMAPMKEGDSVLARNLSNGEYDCALVGKDGAFRVGLPSDVVRGAPQRHVLEFYAGNAFVVGLRDEDKGKACSLKPGAKPVFTIDKFGFDVDYHFQSAPLKFKKGDNLSPIAEGLGLHRGRPEIRRFLGFAQMVLDPADPAVLAKQFLSGEQKYRTGETVNTHAVVVTTIGDMNVPSSTGASIARAAGLLDYVTRRPEWGNRTAAQVLADTKVLEAVDKVPHFQAAQANKDGNGDQAVAGVLFDVEDLSNSAALLAEPEGAGPYPLGHDGYRAPRLKAPLWKFGITDDKKGGVSGALYPYVIPTGKHDLDFPGEQTDRLKKLCKHPSRKDDPVCKQGKAQGFFDHGALVLEGMVKFLGSGGKVFPLEPCQSTWTCGDVPAVPGKRE